jgi:hypothetical protein
VLDDNNAARCARARVNASANVVAGRINAS